MIGLAVHNPAAPIDLLQQDGRTYLRRHVKRGDRKLRNIMLRSEPSDIKKDIRTAVHHPTADFFCKCSALHAVFRTGDHKMLPFLLKNSSQLFLFFYILDLYRTIFSETFQIFLHCLDIQCIPVLLLNKNIKLHHDLPLSKKFFSFLSDLSAFSKVSLVSLISCFTFSVPRPAFRAFFICAV